MLGAFSYSLIRRRIHLGYGGGQGVALTGPLILNAMMDNALPWASLPIARPMIFFEPYWPLEEQFMTSTTLTPAAERIVQLALQHFANRGYDAASLNDIAVSAGIKKASLYAHFTGKDELYISVLNLALQSERDYVGTQFSMEENGQAPGERYVLNLQRRYAESAALRFLLRAAFYPPAAIEEKVKSGFGHYLKDIHERFLASLESQYSTIGSGQAGLLAEVYLALIDSLHVELIYGNEAAYSRRLDALRQIISITGLPLVEGSTPK